MMSRRGTVIALALSVGLAGCSTVIGEAIDTAARRTGQGIGEAVGQRTGQMAGAAVSARFPDMWTPDMSAVYVNYLFSVAFHSGSYTVSEADYQPGEWTRWRLAETGDEGRPSELERAFLARTDEGREWWRVKYVIDDGESVDSLTVEMLFDRESGEVLRMRGKMPGEEQAKEMPVEEGTYNYVQPTKLTPESVEGATVGVESVGVPAGTFQARHIRYGGMAGGTLDWWLNDDVPGHMVKYSRSTGESATEGPDRYNWTLELLEYGTDATSELGVL